MRIFVFVLWMITVAAFPGGSLADGGLDALDKGDYEGAIAAWAPLAEQGDAEAQYNLAQMYFNGWGVPRDYVAAYKWFTLAAELGDDPKAALRRRDKAAVWMTVEQVAKAQRLADSWFDDLMFGGADDSPE